MKLSLLPALLLGLTLGAPRAFAAEPPVATVRPGAVATAVVTFAAPVAGETARFSIEPAAGVRVLGATSGLLPAGGASARRVPVTFSVPATATAGELVGGTVTLRWAGGRIERQELRVRVDMVRRLTLSLSVAEPIVQPGGAVRITYRLTNLGNAADTVHVEPQVGAPWSVSPPSDSRVLPAGATVEGQLEVRAPRSAPLGEQRLVQVRAAGRGGDQRASLALLVAENAGGAFGLAQLPTSVFLGGSSAGGTNLAISGRGTIGPDTEVGLAIRRLGSFAGQTYGQTDLWGPRALLSVRHGAYRAQGGDLSIRSDGLLAGAIGTGTGVELRREGAGVSGGVVLARPRAGLGAARDGHLLQGELGYALAGGILSARLFDLGWGQASLLRAGRLQVAGVRYQLEGNGPHRLSAEAGVVRQGVGRADQTQGAAMDAAYAYSTPALALSAHLRSAPDALEGTTLAGDEATLSGSARVLPFARLSGSLYWGARERVGATVGDETRGASTGIQLHGGASSLGLAWSTRQHQSPFALGGAEERSSLAASLGTGVGPLSLRANAEVGTVARGEAEPYAVRRAQAQLRWSQPSRSAWLSASYTDEHLFHSPVQGEVGTQLRLGQLNLDAAVGAILADGTAQMNYLHAGTELYLSRALSLVAGAEYTPWSAGGSPWTFSFGIRRALSLPLPVRERPRVGGVIFEDGNGNGRQDDGEPGIAGIPVTIGPLKTVTGADGRFAFRQAVSAGLPVQMDVGSLGEGYLALFSETLVPAGGRIEMPVVRAAGLNLRVFTDRDGDGARGGTEPGLVGAVVVLRDAAGRSHPRATDADGVASFSALPPGAYTVSVMRDGREAASARVELTPGARAAHEVAVAALERQIKMWGGSAAPAPR